MGAIEDFLSKVSLDSGLFGNTLREYLFAFAVFLTMLIVIKIMKIYLVRKMKNISYNSIFGWWEVLMTFFQKIGWPAYIMFSIYVSMKLLVVPEIVEKVAFYIFLFIAIVYAIKACFVLIDYFVAKQAKGAGKSGTKNNTHFINLLGSIAKFSAVLIAVLFLLSNLGFNITSLLAGVGIGGIAIAFAMQNILEDLFSSFSIHFDKLFREGDFIIVGTDMGTIKSIGLRSTRIQTLQGEELIISNKELTNTRINNFKEMDNRRALFTFGIVYQTPKTKVKKVPAIVRKIIKEVKLASLDRVHFKSFGDFALIYEVVYFVDSKEYKKYMDVQQQINLRLFEEFEKEKIEFAYPTQTIYHQAHE